MVIHIHGSAIRGLVREVTRRDGDIDATYARPETTGASGVVDEYCSALSDALRAVRRYRTLVDQDSEMVESVVEQMESVDEAMSALVGSIGAGGPAGSTRGV